MLIAKSHARNKNGTQKEPRSPSASYFFWRPLCLGTLGMLDPGLFHQHMRSFPHTVARDLHISNYTKYILFDDALLQSLIY